MNGNWIDGVILVLVGYYLLSGWQTGVVYLSASLVSFLGSLVLSLRFYGPVGEFFGEKFGTPAAWANVIGFMAVAFVAESALSEGMSRVVRMLPKKYLSSKANRGLGALVSAVNGIVVVTFITLGILALPLRGTVKADIRSSRMGSFFLQAVERYGGPVTVLVNKAAQEAQKFLTINPLSTERIPLDSLPEKTALTVDAAAEQRMVDLVNAERSKTGLPQLVVDAEITEVARAHSRDMFERRYFSHVSPEGKDAGDRLTAAGVSYSYAGENLAYAPDVATAHEGLMNSEGHRKNILDPEFRHIGIGVIDGGVYGRMFTQNFTD